MTFNTLESSIEDGRPVSLYVFTFGSTVWRYTSADEDLDVGGNTYKAAAISDDGVRQSGEAAADMLTLNAPSWVGPAQVFMRGAPSRAIEVTILAKHETNAETQVVYSGEISQVNYPLPGAARIVCETLSATLAREGLRLGWQRSCPYALYDPLTCKVNKAAWGTAITVLGINGYEITVDGVSGLDDGDLNGGFIEWAHPVRGVEYIPIEAHAGDVLTALTFLGELYVGASGTAYPGCNFTPENCQAFGNYDNYGGVPGLPGKSPFDGDPVF